MQQQPVLEKGGAAPWYPTLEDVLYTKQSVQLHVNSIMADDYILIEGKLWASTLMELLHMYMLNEPIDKYNVTI